MEIVFVQLCSPALPIALNMVTHPKPQQWDSRKHHYLARVLSDVNIAIAIVFIHDNSFHDHPKLLWKTVKL